MLTKRNITFTRAEPNLTVVTVLCDGERLSAHVASFGRALFADLLRWRRFFHEVVAQNAISRRSAGIRNPFGIKKVWMFSPKFVIRFGVTCLAERYQIAFGVRVSNVFEQPKRNDMMTIKRFSCANNAATLARKGVTLKDRQGYFGPLLPPVRYFTHAATIAPYGSLCK